MRPPTLAAGLGALLLTSLALLSSSAAAHPMVAQHGTLNLVGDGVFMVLSLPVSAFDDVDDDGDGKLSMDELRTHRIELLAAVERNVTLSDDAGARPLQGLMLVRAPPDEGSDGPASQLIAMGRFALADPDTPLRFAVGLYGNDPDERVLEIDVTRPSDGHDRQLVLTPERPALTL